MCSAVGPNEWNIKVREGSLLLEGQLAIATSVEALQAIWHNTSSPTCEGDRLLVNVRRTDTRRHQRNSCLGVKCVTRWTLRPQAQQEHLCGVSCTRRELACSLVDLVDPSLYLSTLISIKCHAMHCVDCKQICSRNRFLLSSPLSLKIFPSQSKGFNMLTFASREAIFYRASFPLFQL